MYCCFRSICYYLLLFFMAFFGQIPVVCGSFRRNFDFLYFVSTKAQPLMAVLGQSATNFLFLLLFLVQFLIFIVIFGNISTVYCFFRSKCCCLLLFSAKLRMFIVRFRSKSGDLMLFSVKVWVFIVVFGQSATIYCCFSSKCNCLLLFSVNLQLFIDVFGQSDADYG